MARDRRRKITPDEFERVQVMLHQLADLTISKKKEEIFWDTEGGGLVDPGALDRFCDLIDQRHVFELERAAAAESHRQRFG